MKKLANISQVKPQSVYLVVHKTNLLISAVAVRCFGKSKNTAYFKTLYKLNEKNTVSAADTFSVTNTQMRSNSIIEININSQTLEDFYEIYPEVML